uniref:GDP-Man:Man(3)GlcNAc(2)-PP-Dol alpha-1,2-mannosyltransferase n=1 Tax=Graphocephala atropunctata TaxID=36148 RepID=A0A1B6K913_9HEMI
MVIATLFTFIIVASTVITIGYFILVKQLRKRRVTRAGGVTVGIFHPYCNAGGGGEKVLWCAIRALQNKYDNVNIVVYTGDVDVTPEKILALATRRLNTPLPRSVKFVYLHTRSLVEADRYPVCTLLGQSLGSVVLGAEAMLRYLPDVYVDTMGYAFTLPLFSWVGGCKVGCYVHYPTITSDMLQRVSERVETHNNRAVFARSRTLTGAKLLYYRAFAWLYRVAGGTADVVMVNSSWTKAHVLDLWQEQENTHLVYPPCDILSLRVLDRKVTGEVRVVSLAQFRPEKDHPLQVKTFQIIKSKVTPKVWSKVKLVLIGSCRDADDEARVDSIRRMAEELSVASNVEFKVNISFDELKEQFALGTVGLHTMWNEHFGIGIVECMAAGLVMLAHRSGGPKLDIIEEGENNRTGFLAETAEEYADVIVRIINTPGSELDTIREAARKSVERFSINSFEEKFLSAMSPLLDIKKTK